MKFVDEAQISVAAGHGGPGCLSFHRAKNRPRGKPDGGDGGDGGSVWLQADPALDTLVDFRYQPQHCARNGDPGRGSDCRGRSAEDLTLRVPVGTILIDADTAEHLGDLSTPGQRLCVAQGGFHGLGNARFKSSTNRTPRQTTPGTPGESRNLRLELSVLADVGLLGTPNAGKSTLLTQVSAARPKIAPYPFTTLIPNLGVVALDHARSFVLADIPGLVPGAATGRGLGTAFLKHLTRTRLLLHLVDIAPPDGACPAASVRAIEAELAAFSPTLAARERWLVLNKIDLLPPADHPATVAKIRQTLAWKAPLFTVSAATGQGCAALCQSIMTHLEQPTANTDEAPEAKATATHHQQQIPPEPHPKSATLATQSLPP